MKKAIVDTLRHNLRQALNVGQRTEAEEILAHLKKEDPLNRETRGFELEFYLITNRLLEASDLARQLCNLFPDSGRIFFLAGKVAYRQKQYPEAVLRFRDSQRNYPHWQTQQWLGKTLTQMGQFEEAESLLFSAREQSRHVVLDLAWLYERNNDLERALKAYQEYLDFYPGHAFAAQQCVRIKAKMLHPEALIEEIDTLAEVGEQTPDVLLPEFVQSLFETGQTTRAREEVLARVGGMDARTGIQIAWVCYRARAYDLACSLFLRHLQGNVSNYKYLNSLESAAAKCGRLTQVLESYRGIASQAPHLHGRCRTLDRRISKERAREK